MKTLVIGASGNTGRISNQLIRRLSANGMEVYAMGKTKGTVENIPIQINWPNPGEIHTVSIYISPRWQTEEWQEKLIEIQPKRVIFNPGTENADLIRKLKAQEIEVFNACTLVMVSTGQF